MPGPGLESRGQHSGIGKLDNRDGDDRQARRRSTARLGLERETAATLRAAPPKRAMTPTASAKIAFIGSHSVRKTNAVHSFAGAVGR
ncbi:MAG: hypothetical protein V3W36_06225, partial [Acidimicrobiia bacterium]